ncbi:unnamed protein product [Protopolystoma xenopodis]|uniref:Uncharacterized protein n=1 Tax=Protopolystoma xenopodis TaxID=117903 RepID=A0A3S5CR91_9PLAT|nr:unnamed protein product [Protopolystoma xenopodis]
MSERHCLTIGTDNDNTSILMIKANEKAYGARFGLHISLSFGKQECSEKRASEGTNHWTRDTGAATRSVFNKPCPLLEVSITQNNLSQRLFCSTSRLVGWIGGNLAGWQMGWFAGWVGRRLICRMLFVWIFGWLFGGWASWKNGLSVSWMIDSLACWLVAWMHKWLNISLAIGLEC